MNIEFKGNVYELPKWTLKLAKMQDEVEKETTNEMLYKKSYEFVKVVIPKSPLEEILDGKTIETVDLIELNNLYKEICGKYIDALQETSLERTATKLDRLSGIVDTVEKIANANEKMNKK